MDDVEPVEISVRKPGSTVLDARLGYLREDDARNWAFTDVLAVDGFPARSQRWPVGMVLDQGREGACVGASLTHIIAARPANWSQLLVKHFGSVSDVMERFAKQNVYWRAQRIDPWDGGEYPGARPRMAGTSLLAGLKVVQAQRWFEAYRFAYSAEETAAAVVEHGPVLLGSVWFEGMMNPGRDGVVDVDGRVFGGHAVAVVGFDANKGRFEFVNSWGARWGKQGHGFLAADDLELLLADRVAEVAVPVDRARNQ